MITVLWLFRGGSYFGTISWILDGFGNILSSPALWIQVVFVFFLFIANFGILFGPLLGMLCYVAALKSAPAGIVTTITFMAPLLIIPIGAFVYGTLISAAVVLGTCISLAGVALLGIG